MFLNYLWMSVSEPFPEDNIPEFVTSNLTDSEFKNENINSELNENCNDKVAEFETQNNLTKPQSKSTLSCNKCNKRFFKSHRLEGHLRQHQGLKVDISISYQHHQLIFLFFSHVYARYVAKFFRNGPDWAYIWVVGIMTNLIKSNLFVMLKIVTKPTTWSNR